MTACANPIYRNGAYCSNYYNKDFYTVQSKIEKVPRGNRGANLVISITILYVYNKATDVSLIVTHIVMITTFML